MSFAGNNKRAAFDYEDDLAAYTSSGRGDMMGSPDGSSQRPNKRRAFGMSGARNTTTSQKNTSMSSSSSPSFVTTKTGYYQQHVEQLSQQLSLAIIKLGPTETKKATLVVANYLRLLQEVKSMYHQPTGRVLAMGNDDCNALGIAESDDDDKLVEYPPTFTRNIPSKITHVAAGGTHSAALSEEGIVYTFGNNDDFALGRDVAPSELHLAGPVDLPEVMAIGAGDNHTLYLTVDGTVYMSGMYKDMDSGKFANVKPGEKLKKDLAQKDPVPIPFPQPVYKIAAGHSANAAILRDGSLYTWGMGHSGELGRSVSMGAPLTSTESGCPQYDLGKMFIGEIYTTMEKDKNGKMVEVENYRYFLDLIHDKFLTPAPVEWATPGNYEVLDVAVGECHMVVVAREKNANGMTRVYSCGHNNYGQLGHGDRVQRHALTPIKALDGHEIAQVACGTHHTLFLTLLGNVVYACGRSDYGQLGLFDTKEKQAGGYQSKPAQVPFPKAFGGSTRIAFIAAGASNSAATTDTGDVYTWGFNETASTGHHSKERDGSNDIERATLLNPMRYYEKHQPYQGKVATVSSVSLGGQHSLMVVQPYLE